MAFFETGTINPSLPYLICDRGILGYFQLKTMASKTALVTGATGLLGRQVVKAFASRDWTVKGTGFSRADGTSVLKVDLSDPVQIERVLDEHK